MYSNIFAPEPDLTCADTNLFICGIAVETPVLFSGFISEGARTYKILHVNAIPYYWLVDCRETSALFHFILCYCEFQASYLIQSVRLWI